MGKSQCYSAWNTSGGNNTQDKVFLLSYAEANKYFGVTYSGDINTKSRVAPTAYAIAQGAFRNSSKHVDSTNTGWLLRSPGSVRGSAAFVFPDGSLGSIGVSYDSSAVRPALWVNLEADVPSY